MTFALPRVFGYVRNALRPNVRQFRLYRDCTRGKAGLEIGGPSPTFRPRGVVPVYPLVGSLDNCDFSSTTVWADHGRDFHFSPNRPPGKSILADGSQLTPVPSASYDFVLSSHNLEHFANPVKALHEWKRVLRPNGALVLILPFYRNTFDHNRSPTPVSDMLDDYARNVGEDDLSHLPEILEKHDLSRDPGAGSFEDFNRRSLDNFNNRCLHHHVFDQDNSRELLIATGFKVLALEVTYTSHICLLARV